MRKQKNYIFHFIIFILIAFKAVFTSFDMTSCLRVLRDPRY